MACTEDGLSECCDEQEPGEIGKTQIQLLHQRNGFSPLVVSTQFDDTQYEFQSFIGSVTDPFTGETASAQYILFAPDYAFTSPPTINYTPNQATYDRIAAPGLGGVTRKVETRSRSNYFLQWFYTHDSLPEEVLIGVHSWEFDLEKQSIVANTIERIGAIPFLPLDAGDGRIQIHSISTDGQSVVERTGVQVDGELTFESNGITPGGTTQTTFSGIGSRTIGVFYGGTLNATAIKTKRGGVAYYRTREYYRDMVTRELALESCVGNQFANELITLPQIHPDSNYWRAMVASFTTQLPDPCSLPPFP